MSTVPETIVPRDARAPSLTHEVCRFVCTASFDSVEGGLTCIESYKNGKLRWVCA